MAYVRLDDQIDEHPKILRAGPAAAWMWAMAIAYSNRRLTDGFVPVEQIHRLTSVRGPAALKLAEVCVRERLFDAVEGGYRVHDYLDLNPTKEKAETAREAAARRKAEQRDREESGHVTRMSQRDRGVTQPAVTHMSQRDINGQTCDLAGAPATPLPSYSPPTPTPPEGEGAVAPTAPTPPVANPFMPRQAWLSLVECWNKGAQLVPAWIPVDSGKVRGASQGVLLKALRECPDLGVWESRFARAVASAWLTGQQPGRDGVPFVADLWWLLDHVSELDAGRYDTRLAVPRIMEPAPFDAEAAVAAQLAIKAARRRA